MKHLSGFIEEPDHVVVRSAVLISRRPGKSILPCQRTVEVKTADQSASPGRSISRNRLAPAKWQIVIPREDKNFGPVIVAGPVADAGVDKELMRLMRQGLGPGEVAQELKGVTESFVYPDLQGLVAACRLISVVPQVLRPSKRGTEFHTQQLGASVEIGSAIVLGICGSEASHRTGNWVDVLRSAFGTKIRRSDRRAGAVVESRNRLRVGTGLVRRVEHIVRAMAAHVGELQRHGWSDLALDSEIPGVKSGKSHPKRPGGYAYSIRQREVAVRRNGCEREAGRALGQIENRRSVGGCIQVLRNLRGEGEGEDLAISVS